MNVYIQEYSPIVSLIKLQAFTDEQLNFKGSKETPTI